MPQRDTDVTDERDKAEPIADLPAPACATADRQAGESPAPAALPACADAQAGEEATSGLPPPAGGQAEERAPWLAPYRWPPGQSGNPTGRPRESGSLAAALRRVGVKPAKTRAELTKLAQQLGMDPEEAQNIDVIAGLIYDGITQLLIRTVKGSTGAGDKLVGLLQLLFKALDGDEKRITLSGPGELEATLASVSAVLGFKAGVYELPQADDGAQSGDELSET